MPCPLDRLVDASFSYFSGLGWSIQSSRDNDGRAVLVRWFSIAVAIPVNFVGRFRNTDERVQGKKHQCGLDPYGSDLFCRIRI